MSMIIVLRAIARLNIGGPAIHVHLLTKGINPDRFNTTLVTGTISPEEGDMSYLFESVEDGYQIIAQLQREISPVNDFKAFLNIFRMIRSVKPDIAHTHTAKAGFIVRFAVICHNILFKRKIKIVHTFHGHVFDGYFSRVKAKVFLLIEKILALNTDAIIAISNKQKIELAEKYKVASSQKIKTIPLGFDLTPFLNNEHLKGGFGKKINFDQDEILIGIVGRLVPIKNHLMFFQAARILINKMSEKKIRLVIIGDGELRDELEAYCRSLEIQDKVSFVGWVKDVNAVYADLDLLVLTSLNEGTPVSIIEAMASRVPVISTAVGGVGDLMGREFPENDTHSFNICERGLLVETGDSNGLADGMMHVLKMDEGKKAEIIENARNFAQKSYGKARLIKDIESLYFELMR
jgi:glycosyltransferase involved in cell wall biosynthesis